MFNQGYHVLRVRVFKVKKKKWKTTIQTSCVGGLDGLSKLFISNPGCFPTKREESSHYEVKAGFNSLHRDTAMLCPAELSDLLLSQQARTCTQHFQANSRGLRSSRLAAGKGWRGCRDLQTAAKENLMGKTFTQTPGCLQSLAIALTVGEDLGTAQKQQAQDTCILYLQPYLLLYGLQTMLLAFLAILGPNLCRSRKIQITIYRTCILHSLPAPLQAVSCLKKAPKTSQYWYYPQLYKGAGTCSILLLFQGQERGVCTRTALCG